MNDSTKVTILTAAIVVGLFMLFKCLMFGLPSKSMIVVAVLAGIVFFVKPTRSTHGNVPPQSNDR